MLTRQRPQQGLPLGPYPSSRRGRTFPVPLRFRPRRIALFAIFFSIAIVYVYLRSPSPSSPSRSAGHSPSKEGGRRDTKRDSQRPLSKGKQKPVTNQRPKHYYRSDGIVDVNLEGSHPVFELVARAEVAWKAKHDRASKTLQEAVAEYRRRYNRAPPLGFDKWWEYVQEHKVLLPDEYDRINHDIEQFWGIDATALAESQSELEAKDGSFTIVSQGGKVSLEVQLGATFDHDSDPVAREYEFRQRAEGQVELLKTVQEWLPDFRATFGSDRVPSQLVPNRAREAAIRAARHGKVLDGASVRSPGKTGWAAGCPPTSALAKNPNPPVPDMHAVWTNYSKSMVHDHSATMDPCRNPSLVHLSGFFQSQQTAVEARLAPAFTTCTTGLHNDILSVPAHDALLTYTWGAMWNQKKHSKLYWRGFSTGALYDLDHPHWNVTHKVRLVEATNSKDGEIYVLPGTENRLATIGSSERVETGWLNDDWMDVKFIGKPMGCEARKGGASLCREL